MKQAESKLIGEWAKIMDKDLKSYPKERDDQPK